MQRRRDAALRAAKSVVKLSHVQRQRNLRLMRRAAWARGIEMYP